MQTGKPVIVSSALSTGCQLEGDAKLFCVAQYPAQPEGYLDVEYDEGGYDGISDHTRGIAVSLGAVTLGAYIVEKHFAPWWLIKDRCPDWVVSIDQRMMRGLTEGVQQIWRALAKGPDVASLEAPVAKWATFRLVAKRTLDLGTRIGRDDVVAMRAEAGIPACFLERVIGSTTRTLIMAGEPVMDDEVEQ